MPATVIESPLGISCVFNDGRTAEFHLDGLPCRELVRNLLFGLVEMIHPHGSIDSAHSVDNALPSIRQLAGHGASLLGRFHIVSRYQWFRKWVNSPAGLRLGLAPIPDGRLNIRMLHRKLGLELAYRPGGLLAAKIVLHHVSAATTEGYASRPGGAQAHLLAEISEQEQQRNLDLLWAEFRNYQQGIMPAGPGARDLVDFFAHVDQHLGATPNGENNPVRVQRANRDMLNLLSKRARTLHLGASNYCWFADSSRALCLKLAGTPTADRPLIGMCDSARCPQATHHNLHRPVWAEHAARTATFLGQLGPTRKPEKARLQSEYDRALRVVADIDAAAAAQE